jgi:hypothetical protein
MQEYSRMNRDEGEMPEGMQEHVSTIRDDVRGKRGQIRE